VLAPDAKPKTPTPHSARTTRRSFPNRLGGKRGNQMRDEAETRKHGDVDFGLHEKPEEALPKNGYAIRTTLAG